MRRTARLPMFLTAGVKGHPQLPVESRCPLALNGEVLPFPVGPGLQAGRLTVWCRLPSGAQEGRRRRTSADLTLLPQPTSCPERLPAQMPHTWVLFCQALLSGTSGVCLSTQSPRCQFAPSGSEAAASMWTQGGN